jgi:hypothetical protein
MVWTERVLSLQYQVAKTSARATLKAIVVVCSSMPRLSTRLSLNRVPTTLIRTTASQ